MMRGLVGIVVVALLALGYLSYDRTRPVEHASVAKPTRTLNILFLGNSYTYVNDLPGMIMDIAASDAGNHTALEVNSITQGAARLMDLWKRADVQAALTQRWNFVVLQDQSEWASLPVAVALSEKIAPEFAAKIRAGGGVPVFYETWPREPGSNWYTNSDTAFLSNAETMTMNLHSATSAIAEHNHAAMVAAGDCWKYALDNGKDLHLYESDGSHPSPAGTYLTALMFYHYFTGRGLDAVNYLPQELNTADAASLKGLLARCPQF